uniref:Uncharacterized protein n=1 Tax=Timema cristinae TaxID=61476 RepID=A0A7R9CQ98_TIMCR|nr:unnamed protein product [Timema cristinae]
MNVEEVYQNWHEGVPFCHGYKFKIKHITVPVGCIRIVYLCSVALTRALDSCIGNHVTKCRSVRIGTKDGNAPFSRSWSPWIQRLPDMHLLVVSVAVFDWQLF